MSRPVDATSAPPESGNHYYNVRAFYHGNFAHSDFLGEQSLSCVRGRLAMMNRRRVRENPRHFSPFFNLGILRRGDSAKAERRLAVRGGDIGRLKKVRKPVEGLAQTGACPAAEGGGGRSTNPSSTWQEPGNSQPPLWRSFGSLESSCRLDRYHGSGRARGSGIEFRPDNGNVPTRGPWRFRPREPARRFASV